MDGLLETESEMKAIGHIIAELETEKLAKRSENPHEQG